MIATNEAAGLLLEARTKCKPLSKLPDAFCPKNENAAYETQNVLTDQMLKTFGGHRIGYKVACTNAAAQALLDVDEPFYGLLLSPFVHKNAAQLMADKFSMRIVEPEFAFEMAVDLPARDKPYTKDEVSKAIAAVLPSIEIVDSRFIDWTLVGTPSLIADNACNGAWIPGKPYKNWTELDLANHEIDLYINNSIERKGRGDAVMGHPLNVLTWLANILSKHGKGLKAGEFVSTGITTKVYLAKPGDHIVADFGHIGKVELSFNGTSLFAGRVKML